MSMNLKNSLAMLLITVSLAVILSAIPIAFPSGEPSFVIFAWGVLVFSTLFASLVYWVDRL